MIIRVIVYLKKSHAMIIFIKKKKTCNDNNIFGQ